MQAKIIPILELIKHRRYVEPFGGGASILIGKKPVDVETYNDLDSALYDFFMVLSDPVLFEQFKRRVEVLPYSRQLYNECRETWKETSDRIERVVKWFVIARQSFGGNFSTGWGYSAGESRYGMSADVSNWVSCIKMLPEIHARLQRVQIENNDWRKILDAHDSDETLFYLDPPYITSTRKAGDYKHELSDQDHNDLITALLNLKGSAVLSGYPSEIYKPLENASWERIDFQTVCYAAGRTRASNLQGKGAVFKHQPRTECLWIKPHEEKQMRFFV